MLTVSRVQARGQVTVPREVRQACGIGPGTDLLFTPCGPGRFECEALQAPLSLRESTERYTVDAESPDIDALLEEMGDEFLRDV